MRSFEERGLAPKISSPPAWDEGVWGRTTAPSPSRRAQRGPGCPRQGCDNIQVTSQCSLTGEGMEGGQGEGQEPFGQRLGALVASVEVMVVAG